MAIYLDEDMVGEDPTKIGFPHLVLCMGVVVVMGDGSLIGAHFTKPTTEPALLRLFAEKVRSNGSGMNELYCLANVAEHVDLHSGLDIYGKAKGIGFTGQGYVADFGVLNPTDGTYAEVTSNGAGNRETVSCKLNQQVTYATAFRAGPDASMVRTTGGTLASGEKWSGTKRTTMKTSTVGATAPFLSTPFLRPVTIT